MSRTYRTWANMKQRCLNPSHRDYEYYGGRGIVVCNDWLEYENFRRDMGNAPIGHQLERKENDKGYYKDNCVWATKSEQMYNRRQFRNNTSKITGVAWHSRSSVWLAYAGMGGNIRLYWGQDFFDACCARKSWEAHDKASS